MKENIKDLKKWLFQGLWILIILSVWWLTFWLVKSRTVSDPDLWDNGSSLYTSVNETLTAAKRNALVKSTKRVDVPTSDTALFDMNCDRKFQAKWSDGNIIWYYTSLFLWDRIYSTTDAVYRYISNTSKSTITTTSSKTRTLLKLQKKCQ